MKHKKKFKKYHPLHHLMKGQILIPLLFVIIAFGVMLTSGVLVNKSAVDKTEQFGEAEVSSGSGKQNLQLKTITFKPKPAPSNDCNHDMSQKINPDDCGTCQAWFVYCKNNLCSDFDPKKSSMPGQKDQICQNFDQNQWCKAFSKGDDGWYCIGKPVIYLYPEKATLVSVTVKTGGKIVISNPLYPAGGWHDILANPDGTLLYQNKQYRELFYESETRELKKPVAGIVFDTAKLETELRSFIIKLGLTRLDEQKEFLDWWIPKLKNLNSPYIFVSILDDTEKKRLDDVEISPKPDTFIDFIAYFEPRQTDINPSPLVLPQTPKRAGFTAIEWGGVIGR
jgi:hypothetical protein